MKKLLSIVLALSLCLTAMMGCFVVSAAEANTVEVTGTAFNVGEVETVSAKIEIASTGFAAAMLDISFEGLDIKAKALAEGETDNGVYEPDITVSSTAAYDIVVSDNSINDDGFGDVTVANGTDTIRLILDAADTTLGYFEDATIVINFVAPTAGTYEVKVDAISAGTAGTYDVSTGAYTGGEETLLNDFSIKNSSITAHAHEYDIPDFDTTGHWNECKCGATDGFEKHTFDNYVADDNGTTETATCTCGATDTRDIEVVEPEGPIYDPDNVAIGGKNAVFESAFSLIYYVKESIYNAYDEFTIDVVMDLYEGNTLVEPRKVTLTEDNLRLKKDGSPDFYVYKNENYYVFLLDGIAVKEVANKILATPKAVKNGISYYGKEQDYNLVTYAAKYSGQTTDFAKSMIAFLNYAAAAQERFGYNTNSLANASLTDAEKVVTLGSNLTDDKTPIPSGYNGDVTIYGFNVAYEAQVQMVVYLKFATGFDFSSKQLKLVYTDAFGDQITDYVDLTDIDEYYSSTILTVRYSGIAIKDMRSIVSMTVIDSDEKVISNERDYSFTSYAYAKASDTDGPVSKAMIAFADAFRTYKSKSN